MYEMAICDQDGKVLRRFDLTRKAEEDEFVRIGRADDCDIQIRHGSISRHHCELEPLDEETWVIRDLDSTQGCLVKGERIKELTVQPGLEVQVGSAMLRFESITARIAAEIEKDLAESQ